MSLLVLVGVRFEFVFLHSLSKIKNLDSCPIQFFDLLGVGGLEELVEVMLRRRFVRISHVRVLVRADLSTVGQVDRVTLVKRPIDILLVQILDHWLVIVASELLVVVVNLHARTTP